MGACCSLSAVCVGVACRCVGVSRVVSVLRQELGWYGGDRVGIRSPAPAPSLRLLLPLVYLVHQVILGLPLLGFLGYVWVQPCHDGLRCCSHR